MTILRGALAPLKFTGYIEAFNLCNTEQGFTFLSMNLITHPQHLFSLAVSFGKEMKEY